MPFRAGPPGRRVPPPAHQGPSAGGMLMLRSFWKKSARPNATGRRRCRKKWWQGRFLAALESRRDRIAPAVVASFSSGAGLLTVFGDGAANTITLSRDAAGTILVNNGAVAVSGGTATVANVALIQVFGQAGNDTITLD